MSAPVKYTCPKIDEAIRSVRGAILYCKKSKNIEDIEELKECFLDISCEIGDVEYILEDLRSDNDALRNWGTELEEKIEELESQIKEIIDN